MTLVNAIIFPTLALANGTPAWQGPGAQAQDAKGLLNDARCNEVCRDDRPDRPNAWVDVVLTEGVDNKECTFFCDCEWWHRGGFHNHDIREIELRHDGNKSKCAAGTPQNTEINTWVPGECHDAILKGSGKAHIQSAIVPDLKNEVAWKSAEGCKTFCASAEAKEAAANKTIKAAEYNPHRTREQYRCSCMTSDVSIAFLRADERRTQCLLMPGALAGKGGKCKEHEDCQDLYYCSKDTIWSRKGNHETCQPRKKKDRNCQGDVRKCEKGLKCEKDHVFQKTYCQ